MKIIAESAYNHMGKVSECLALLEAAKSSGADYFTMQIMDPEVFSEPTYSKYQLYIDHNISFQEWDLIFARAKHLEIPLIPCALDMNALEYVLRHDPAMVKVHATDLTNEPFLKQLAAAKTRVLLETQAATNFEIRFALQILGNQVEAILTGYSNYPTELEDINLDSLDFLSKEYGLPYGLADHSPTITDIPLMALAKGCSYLEKHITISRNNRNFDWQVSLYPEEFQILTSKVALFRKSLGTGVKHPVANERPFRNILYKKVTNHSQLQRSDNAPDFISHTIAGFDPGDVTIAIIARLSSQRLTKKVLAKLGDSSVIAQLYAQMKQVKRAKHVVLTTSTDPGDNQLAEYGESNGMDVFRGHPESVIDRMLDLAWKNKSGMILRVTGDNPFTNPGLTDALIQLVHEHKLDYAKANNTPFGLSAEVFSTAYLWKLYIAMDNPLVSEYLTWFVLLDNDCRKGCIDLEYKGKDWSLKNLSIDYPADLEDARRVINCAKEQKLTEIKLSTLLDCCGQELTDKSDHLMKLPGDTTIALSEYLRRWNDAKYMIRNKLDVINHFT